MVYREHVEILKQGWEIWYEWSKRHPDEKLDLQGAFLVDADLGHITDFKGVDLSESTLINVRFNYPNLRNANLSNARIEHCDFDNGNLSGVNLSGANLFGTQFHDVDLRQANFDGCFCGYNVFANVDLSMTTGLESVTHYSASTLGYDTLVRSRGKIADNFLRGCGIADNLIRTLPSFIQKATEYYSCLLMYRDVDKAIVERLYDRLQAAGVRCWLYERTGGNGSKERQMANSLSSHTYDKTIIFCSEYTMNSNWLSHQINRTETFEKIYGDKRLMSLDLDGCLTSPNGRGHYVAMERRLILPFKDWKDEANFELLINEVVKALRSNANPLS